MVVCDAVVVPGDVIGLVIVACVAAAVEATAAAINSRRVDFVIVITLGIGIRWGPFFLLLLLLHSSTAISTILVAIIETATFTIIVLTLTLVLADLVIPGDVFVVPLVARVRHGGEEADPALEVEVIVVVLVV